MAFCKHCGRELENGSKFCPNCGKKLDDKMRWSRKRKIIVVIYIVLVLLTFVYGFIPTLVNPPYLSHYALVTLNSDICLESIKWYEVPIKDVCYSTATRSWFTRVHTDNVITIVAIYCVLLAIPFFIGRFKKRKINVAGTANTQQNLIVDSEAEKK